MNQQERQLKFFGVYDNARGTLGFQLGLVINPRECFWGLCIGFLTVFIIIGPHHHALPKPQEEPNLEK